MKKVLSLLFSVLLIGCGGGGGGTSSNEESSKILATVVISSGNNQTATVGTELPDPLKAILLNNVGLPIEGLVVNFKVVTGGGSVFAGAAISDSNGIVSERWTLGAVAGPQKIEVRAVDSSGTAVVFATFDAMALAGVPYSLSIAWGNNQSAVQLQQLPLPVKVVVRDEYNNPTPGVIVSFQANNGGIAAPASVPTSETGEAEALWTLGIPLGVQTLDASVAGLPPISFGATATQAPPTEAVAILKVSGDFQTIEQHITPCSLTVRVIDVLGNGVPGQSVTFSATPTDEYAKLVAVTTDASGSATSSFYFHTSGQMQVTASSPGLTPVMFTVNVAPNDHVYDGKYCFFVTYGTISGPGCIEGAVNEADGTLSFYGGGCNRTRLYTGQIVVDSVQHATASGTYDDLTMPGVQEFPWSCVRE